MSTIYQSVTGYFSKAPVVPTTETPEPGPEEKKIIVEAENIKENDASEYSSDKKTDEIIEPQKPTSLVWRISSGVVGTTSGAVTGAVGLGYGGIKWVAGKGYNAGSAVVSTTVNTTKTVAQKVPVPFRKQKDKKE